jgi:FAD linked oxidases, C-terminal domain
MILFDVREAGILDRVMAAGREILTRCVEAGGTITGEHGVGLEKRSFMPLIFTAADLRVMARVREAIDPSGNFNPAKVLPSIDDPLIKSSRSARMERSKDQGSGIQSFDKLRMSGLSGEGMWV